MNCEKLAGLIQELQPDASTQDVARLCLLITNNADRLDDLHEEKNLRAIMVGLEQAVRDMKRLITL